MKNRATRCCALLMGLIITVFIAGCGGSNATGAFPTPNPTVKRPLEIRVIGLVPGADAVIKRPSFAIDNASGTSVFGGVMNETGTIVTPVLTEGSYNIRLMTGMNASPHFATTSVTFILAAGNSTATIAVHQSYRLTLSAIKTADATAIAFATITVASTDNISLWAGIATTSATGTPIVFDDVPAGNYRAFISNLGSTAMTPRLGLDTSEIIFSVLSDTTKTIGGDVPACFTDTVAIDCAGSNPGGIVHPGCTGAGNAGATCVWYDGAGRVVTKHQKVSR